MAVSRGRLQSKEVFYFTTSLLLHVSVFFPFQFYVSSVNGDLFCYFFYYLLLLCIQPFLPHFQIECIKVRITLKAVLWGKFEFVYFQFYRLFHLSGSYSIAQCNVAPISDVVI